MEGGGGRGESADGVGVATPCQTNITIMIYF
jgi:hypothetical protein